MKWRGKRFPYHKLTGSVYAFDFFLSTLLFFLVAAQFANVVQYLQLDVVQYDFRTSLFDVWVVSFARTIFLEALYFFVGISSLAPIIACTVISTVYLVIKACFFHFGTGTWLPELMIFGSFLIPWAELFVAIYRGRAIRAMQERGTDGSLRVRAGNTPTVIVDEEQQPLIRTHSIQAPARQAEYPMSTSFSSTFHTAGFITPPESPPESMAGSFVSASGAPSARMHGVDLDAVADGLARSAAQPPRVVSNRLSSNSWQQALEHERTAAIAAVAASASLPSATAAASLVATMATPASALPAPVAAASGPPLEGTREALLFNLEPAMRNLVESVERELLENLVPGEQNDWVHFSDEQNVRMYKKDRGNVNYLKGEGVINCTLEEFRGSVADLAVRAEWDDMYEQGQSCVQLNSVVDIVHLFFKGQFVVSGRDMVVMRGYERLDDKRFLFMSTTVPFYTPTGRTVELARKYVRATLYPTGFLVTVQPGGRSLDIIYVCAMDLAGKIPEWLKKKVSKSLPLTIAKIRKYITHAA